MMMLALVLTVVVVIAVIMAVVLIVVINQTFLVMDLVDLLTEDAPTPSPGTETRLVHRYRATVAHNSLADERPRTKKSTGRRRERNKLDVTVHEVDWLIEEYLLDPESMGPLLSEAVCEGSAAGKRAKSKPEVAAAAPADTDDEDAEDDEDCEQTDIGELLIAHLSAAKDALSTQTRKARPRFFMELSAFSSSEDDDDEETRNVGGKKKTLSSSGRRRRRHRNLRIRLESEVTRSSSSAINNNNAIQDGDEADDEDDDKNHLTGYDDPNINENGLTTRKHCAKVRTNSLADNTITTKYTDRGRDRNRLTMTLYGVDRFIDQCLDDPWTLLDITSCHRRRERRPRDDDFVDQLTSVFEDVLIVGRHMYAAYDAMSTTTRKARPQFRLELSAYSSEDDDEEDKPKQGARRLQRRRRRHRNLRVRLESEVTRSSLLNNNAEDENDGEEWAEFSATGSESSGNRSGFMTTTDNDDNDHHSNDTDTDVLAGK